MPRVSSKTKIDTTISRFLQSNSSKLSPSLVFRLLMFNWPLLLRSMELSSEISNIFHSWMTAHALSMKSMRLTLVPSQHTNQLISTLPEPRLLMLWWPRSWIWLKDIESESENSSKITIHLEREELMLPNSELLFTLRRYNWPLKSTNCLKTISDALKTPTRSDTLISTSELRLSSPRRVWKKTQLQLYQTTQPHQSWTQRTPWARQRRMNWCNQWSELELTSDTVDFWSSHSSKTRIRARVGSSPAPGLDPFSITKSFG